MSTGCLAGFASMNNRQSGFSLLEVLVAFVILALVLAVQSRILSLSSRSLSTAGHYQEALILAESQLAEISAQLSSSSSSHQQGRLGDAYHWQADIEPYEFENHHLGTNDRIKPLLIHLTVGWGDRDAQQVSLTTIRLVEERR